MNKELLDKYSLFGLSGKWAIICGVILWLFSRFVTGDALLSVTVAAMLEISGIWFFLGGLYRLNKEIRAKKKM